MKSVPGTVVKRLLSRVFARRQGSRRAIFTHGRIACIGLSLAVVGLLGFTLHPRLLVLLPGLVALLAIGVGWPWMSVLLLRSNIRFARDRAHEQDEVCADLRIRQAAPWPSWGMLVQLDAAVGCSIKTLSPFSTYSETIRFRPSRRGEFPLSDAWVSTGFPFGLTVARRRLHVNRPLLVWPRLFPVAPPPDWAGADTSGGRVETRLAGPSGETIGVRTYRRGDPMRWIHWPQTARHDSFMVREFPATSTPRTRIVLDCRSSVHVGSGRDGSFEWAVLRPASRRRRFGAAAR